MRRLLVVLMLGLAVVGLPACGNADQGAEEAQQEPSYIDWSSIQHSDLIPEPPSLVGYVEWDRSYGFTIDVTHVDKGAFDRYVEECRADGYVLNFSTRDDYYSAYSEDGCKLALELRDDETLNIVLMLPTEGSPIEDEGTASGSTDTGANAASSESAPTNPAEDTILIKDSNYVISNGFVHYVVELQNNRQDEEALFATITATGKSADGAIVFSDEWVVGDLLPKSTTYWATQAGNGSCSESDTVEFSVSVDSQNWKRTSETLPENLYMFDNVNATPDQFVGIGVTGTVTLMQPSDSSSLQNANTPMLVCVLKDANGKLVAGFSGYMNTELEPRKSTPFEVMSHYDVPDYASVEMHANPWP